MLRFLRFLGVLVSAIWLGALVFGTFAALPLLFSEKVSPGLIPRYHTGMIAQMMLYRFFLLNLFCAIGMVALAGVDRWYTGRIEPRPWSFLPWALLILVALGGFWLQPKMGQLHRIKYATNLPMSQKESAARSFAVWHGVSQLSNLLVIAGVVIVFWRSVQATDPTRSNGASRRFL